LFNLNEASFIKLCVNSLFNGLYDYLRGICKYKFVWFGWKSDAGSWKLFRLEITT